MPKHHVLSVGDDRGFVVDLPSHGRCVITAAHCLPHLPPPGPSLPKERTYQALLGPLRGKRTVGAECLFVDLIADIAVLGQPDTDAYHRQAAAYDKLIARLDPLTIADAPAEGREIYKEGEIEREDTVPGHGPVKLLLLKGGWVKGRASRHGWRLLIEPGGQLTISDDALLVEIEEAGVEVSDITNVLLDT
jgi:hypothetical protein